MTGNLGHDMEFWLDNDLAASKLLNDYFIFNPESYSEGTVSYELNNLAPGSHRLHFRVWDVFDNSTTASLSFFVTDKASEVNGFNVAAVPVSGNSRARRFVTSCPNESEMPLTVTTEVYSLSGTRLWHSSGTIPAGGRYYSVEWDGTNYGGAPVPRGVYLYRSRTKNDETKSHKIVIS